MGQRELLRQSRESDGDSCWPSFFHVLSPQKAVTALLRFRGAEETGGDVKAGGRSY